MTKDPALNANRTACQAASFPQALYEDDFTADRAVDLLRRAPAETPWFLWVSFPGPHSPYVRS